MKRVKQVALLFWLLGASLVFAAPMGIVVPAYFYPGNLWSSLNWAAGRVPLIAIMNPNSGPDTTQDPQYVLAVNNLRAAGGTVIGYVSTSYTTRAASAVKLEIDRYFAFYAVNGIFLDEFTDDSNTNHLNYYADLYSYIQIKGTNLLVMGNPGINTQESYLTRSCADVLVTFEVNTGYSTYVADAWVTNHLARQFCHLPYAVSIAATMTNYVNLAAVRNTGWIYVTTDSGANPWDTLPAYWTNEVNYVQSMNQAAPATQLKLINASNGVPALRISGAPGVYELQTTSNLLQWSAATNVSGVTTQIDISDLTATNAAQRFYRTRQ